MSDGSFSSVPGSVESVELARGRETVLPADPEIHCEPGRMPCRECRSHHRVNAQGSCSVYRTFRRASHAARSVTAYV